MTDNLLERYLTDLGEIRRTRANVPETSFYPALEQLLSGVGKTLSPKVRYQVIEKRLSYRERNLLGRGLTPEEVRYVTEMARRLSALVALRPRLNTNYRQTVAATYAWPARSD